MLCAADFDSTVCAKAQLRHNYVEELIELKEIRVLELRVEQSETQVLGNLKLEPLSSYTWGELRVERSETQVRGNPSYEALSYTWGNTDRIDLGSMEGDLPIALDSYHGPSERLDKLFCALRSLRSSSQTFWIDVVCINQADRHVRGRQVSLMKKIYQESQQTLQGLFCLEDFDQKGWNLAYPVSDSIDVEISGTTNIRQRGWLISTMGTSNSLKNDDHDPGKAFSCLRRMLKVLKSISHDLHAGLLVSTGIPYNQFAFGGLGALSLSKRLDALSIYREIIRGNGLAVQESTNKINCFPRRGTEIAAERAEFEWASHQEPIIVGCIQKYSRKAYGVSSDYKFVFRPSCTPFLVPSTLSNLESLDTALHQTDLVDLFNKEQLSDMYERKFKAPTDHDYWSELREGDMRCPIKNSSSGSNSLESQNHLLIGTFLLWIGWLGFNGGSALGARAATFEAMYLRISKQISASLGAFIEIFLSRAARPRSRSKKHGGQVLLMSMLLWPVATATSLNIDSSELLHQGPSFFETLYLQAAKMAQLFTTPQPPFPRTIPPSTLLPALLLTTTLLTILYTRLAQKPHASTKITKYLLCTSVCLALLLGSVSANDVVDLVFRYLFPGVGVSLMISPLNSVVHRYLCRGEKKVINAKRCNADIEGGNMKYLDAAEEKRSSIH